MIYPKRHLDKTPEPGGAAVPLRAQYRARDDYPGVEEVPKLTRCEYRIPKELFPAKPNDDHFSTAMNKSTFLSLVEERVSDSNSFVCRDFMDFIVVISATRTHLSGLLTEFFNAVTVNLDFVKPVLALGDVLDGEGVHRLDELDGAGLGCLTANSLEGPAGDCQGSQCWAMAKVASFRVDNGYINCY